MIDTIYIEKTAKNYEKTAHILSRFPRARLIECEKYGEVFNRKQQHFRLQKTNPALILAVKPKNRLLPIPKEYTIGSKHNYYFSHLLNCPFDCSYCFLQGMYQSAHFVLFVNYEDFQADIAKVCTLEKTTFFSGYDGDSLALEHVSGFADTFIPFFSKLENAELELRTKSCALRSLRAHRPHKNIIVAYSLNPALIAQKYETKTPSFEQRMRSIEELQKAGWQIGLRFDPVLYVEDFTQHYASFFKEVFSRVHAPHSVTLGTFRVPKEMYKQMRSIAPNNLVIAGNQNEKELLSFCAQEIVKYIPEERFFPCQQIEQYS